MFLNGLTADYKRHMLLYGATSNAEVRQTCRRLDLSARTSRHTRPSALAAVDVIADHIDGGRPCSVFGPPRERNHMPRHRTPHSLIYLAKGVGGIAT